LESARADSVLPDQRLQSPAGPPPTAPAPATVRTPAAAASANASSLQTKLLNPPQGRLPLPLLEQPFDDWLWRKTRSQTKLLNAPQGRLPLPLLQQAFNNLTNVIRQEILKPECRRQQKQMDWSEFVLSPPSAPQLGRFPLQLRRDFQIFGLQRLQKRLAESARRFA
jgi:hypothetical protein